MNRREFVKAGGALAINAAMEAREETVPETIAGIRIVDSSIAKEATDLAREVSPPYLFNHAARTYLFGALVGRARKLKFDEELLYLASIMHDLGLTERFMGDLPFEIQGAQAASQFLEERGLSKTRSAIVWDGIAMHASAIGQFKQPEILLVGEGAGADVINPGSSGITKSEVRQVVAAFPRLKFKDQFVKTCADVVRRHPRGAGHSFMRDIAERYVPEYHPRNICDAIVNAPFDE